MKYGETQDWILAQVYPQDYDTRQGYWISIDAL